MKIQRSRTFENPWFFSSEVSRNIFSSEVSWENYTLGVISWKGNSEFTISFRISTCLSNSLEANLTIKNLVSNLCRSSHASQNNGLLMGDWIFGSKVSWSISNFEVVRSSYEGSPRIYLFSSEFKVGISKSQPTVSSCKSKRDSSSKSITDSYCSIVITKILILLERGIDNLMVQYPCINELNKIDIDKNTYIYTYIY